MTAREMEHHLDTLVKASEAVQGIGLALANLDTDGIGEGGIPGGARGVEQRPGRVPSHGRLPNIFNARKSIDSILRYLLN